MVLLFFRYCHLTKLLVTNGHYKKQEISPHILRILFPAIKFLAKTEEIFNIVGNTEADFFAHYSLYLKQSVKVTSLPSVTV
jgi:hypothetical protein